MKNELRKISLEKRKNLSTDLLSKKIIANLITLEEYKKAKNILCYYPLKYEVQTQECLNDNSKNWFLPRVNNLDLEFCHYNKDELKIGAYGILEPIGPKISTLRNMDMAIIPAVAADINGYRIGYGKGYYDRFLSSFDYPILKVIVIYSELIYPNIFPNEYDKKSDIIVTDKEILRIYC